MAAEDEALKDVYATRGLLRDGRAIHLPTACPNHGACWSAVAASRIPVLGHSAGELSAPWIGPRYSEGRLLVVLENLRDFGGWDLRDSAEVGMRYLGRCARHGFAHGHRILFRGNGYAGTSVWCQAVSYAATWLAAEGLLSTAWSGDRVPGPALAETMDLIGLIQHVKCSPHEHRSNANEAMWANCGRHVLRPELDVLRPRHLLVVGRDRNAGALRTHVLPEAAGPREERRVKIGSRSTTVEAETRMRDNERVALIVVQHPASPGGTSRSLVGAVRELAVALRAAAS